MCKYAQIFQCGPYGSNDLSGPRTTHSVCHIVHHETEKIEIGKGIKMVEKFNAN